MVTPLHGGARSSQRPDTVRDNCLTTRCTKGGCKPNDTARMSGADLSARGIREGAIYYYNRFTGTRHLTYQDFADLGKLADADLARQLQEIADTSAQRNRAGNPEVAFFPPEPAGFGAADFRNIDFGSLPRVSLREYFEGLRRRFHDAEFVPGPVRSARNTLMENIDGSK